jgi:hypothetical protein
MKINKSWTIIAFAIMWSAWGNSCAAQAYNASDNMLAIVFIHDTFADGSAQQAAGIYVGKDQQSAYFITALHALQATSDGSFPISTEVEFYQSAAPFTASVLTTHFNSTYDFGIITVDLSHLPQAMPVLTVATPQLNEYLIAVGHPATGNWSTWSGTVQSTSQSGTLIQNFVSNGAPLAGFSGGGAFNNDGYFEGMHLNSPTASTGTFVKSTHILQQLQAWGIPTDNLRDPNDGPNAIKIKQVIDAIGAHNVGAVQAIASSDANLNGIAGDGSTPLLQAIKSQDVKLIAAVLANSTIDPNFQSRSHEEPLDIAASLNEVDAVKLFLNRNDVHPMELLYTGSFQSPGNLSLVIQLEQDIVKSPSFHSQDVAKELHKFSCGDPTVEAKSVFAWMVSVSSKAIPFHDTLGCEYSMSSKAVLTTLLTSFPYTDTAKADVIETCCAGGTDDPKFTMVVKSYNGPKDVLTEARKCTLSYGKPCAFQNLISLVDAGADPKAAVQATVSHDGPDLLSAIKTCPNEPPQDLLDLLN